MKRKTRVKVPNLYVLVIVGLFITLVVGGILGNFVYNSNQGNSQRIFYSIKENYCKKGYNYTDSYCNGTKTTPKCCPEGYNHLDNQGNCFIC